MVLCESCSVSGGTSVCTFILDGVCVCVRCEGFMHSAGVGVVLCPVCCKGVFVATATESRLILRKARYNTEELCSKTISICLRNTCLEVAGLKETLTRPGTVQEPSQCTHRAGPRVRPERRWMHAGNTVSTSLTFPRLNW